MARVNVYLPDELAEAAQEKGLSVSALAQRAVREALASQSTDAWLAALPTLGSRVTHEQSLDALDGIREDPPTPHG